jgi:hypothetical protein
MTFGMMRKLRNRVKWTLFIFITLILCAQTIKAQTKRFNIQTTLPSSLTVCGKADSLVFEIRNISASGISNIFLTLKFPVGTYYQKSSFIGNGVSESNISNLNAPIFKLSNFTLAGYLRLSVKLTSTCDLQAFVSKGSPAITNLDFTYTGGNESHQTSSVNVSTPNILLNTITNQIKNAYINDKFVREISIKNTGKGGAFSFTFYRTNGNGLKVTSSRAKDKYSKDSIISILDSNDFKLIGNKDAFFDANEEFKIWDTVKVFKCNNLTSIYNTKFGCGNTVCNLSTKNAIVNLDPFIQGLTIIPTSTIDWCFDINKPTNNSVMVINKSNKPILNTEVNIFQSYNGGFYNYQMSAIDTTGMIIRKGKRGPIINKYFTRFLYNFTGSYFSCLGTSPIGGFSLGLGGMNVNDTIFISWKTISCIPDICNTTVTANRWRFSATYLDPCGNSNTLTEDWGSGGGIQYASAIPWIPTDIIAGVPDILNYNITSISLFPANTRSRYAVKLSLQAGIKHSLKPDDIKFTDLNGTDWKPYVVKIVGTDIIGYFNRLNINLLKADLNVVIEADCQASKPNGLKNYTLSILYDTDSTCNNGEDFQLYCNSGQVKVHCTKSCLNGGMLFKSFVVKRKNYGKPDNNNDGEPDASGTLNMARVKTNSSLLYDTISAFYSGIVRSSGSTTIFFNGRIKSKLTNGHLLKPIGANLNIYRSGKLRYSCNKMPYSSSLAGSIMTCEVDLNINSAKLAGCGKISDYFFLNTDSVVVNLNFVYATNIGSNSGEIFFDNSEFYLSTTANPSSSQKLQCDTLSGRHILLGSYFTNWYTENYISNSCTPVTLYNSFYFSAGNCCSNYAGGNPFPNEYRPFNYLEKIKISLPKGYIFSSAAIYYYKSAGHSNYTTHYASNLKPQIKTQDTLLFNLDTLFNPTKGIFKRSEEGYQGTFVLNIIPTCKVSVNTNELVGYYSYFKWPTANVTEINAAYPDSVKFVHPTVLMNAINSVSVSKKDTFSWDIIMSNTQNGNSIDNVWMSNSTAQKVKILSIKDLSTGKDLVVKNGIFRAGTLYSTSARTFRVNAISSNCRLDSFKLAVGWNCDTYPDSLEVYPCKNLMNFINLILSPEPPLIVSTLLEDTARTDVCTNRKFQAIIANVDEDNIYQLKLRVTIPQGMIFVDTGLYYSFPFNSKFRKLSKPILVSGTTYEWSLSDSIADLKNGLERVSDSLKSKIKVQFFLESNCQITAGAFVSIMPDGRIGCGEPVKRVGYTGQPIKIKGVDNPYFTLVTMSPDSINLCNPNVAFKAKVIYLGPTKTLANDSIILTLPLGFEPDTASLTAIRISGNTVRNVNQQLIWSFAIPKGLFPGDSSMLDFKLKITNKAPSCGIEPFTLQSVTKKKAYCVKIQDSCEINVATGSFYKALKLDRANPVIKLIYSKSTNAGDSGEIADIAFSVTNTSKSIDTGFSTSFKLIIDKNSNGKQDAGETSVQQFTKSSGWLSKQIVNFNFKGFVKNTDICKLIIVPDSSNCQCLKYSLPILNLQLKNAGRDTSFCSNYQSTIGLDSVKNYKYEWLPSDYLQTPFKSYSVYKKPNNTNKDDIRNYLLKTSRPGGCISTDTVIVKGKSFLSLPKLKDTAAICLGSNTAIGDTARGGKTPLIFRWSPSTGLSSSVQMVVKANPKVSTKYYLTVSDQNNCSIKDSTYVNVAKLPKVKIATIGNCEKKDVQFLDQSDYFGQPKGSALWRIDFNNISQVDPVFVFDTIGYFFSRLIVSNKYGCTDSNYAYIRINGNPNVFNSKINQCLGDSIQFLDSSWVARMNVKTIHWAFASDTVSGKKTAKLFNKSGVYHFNQIVSSDSGCVTSLSDSVIIIDRPKASFSKTGTCVYDSIEFTNISKAGQADSLTSFSWILGNQNLTKDQFKYKFDSAGTYSIRLSVISRNGCKDTVNKTIKISPKPKALFTVTNQCVYDSVRVNNLSSISSGNIVKYQWTIPSLYSNQSNKPILGKIKEGNYTLKLNIKSDSLCVDSSENMFVVYPSVLPKIAFTPACENESMSISDISKQTNTRVSSRLWTLGSSQYTDSTFLIGLTTKGNYPIHLDLSTKEGCNFSLDTTYEVFENPVADFTSTSDCNDEVVKFTDLSTPGNKASILSRLWFENSTQIFNGNNFTMKFPSSGNHQISLRLQNSLGCVDSVIKTINVSPVNYADFTVNDACPEDTVTLKFTGFTGTNSIGSFNLSWGDGDKSTNLPASHAYSSSGNYTIRLSAQTDKGCVIDTFKTIKIHPKPLSKFDYYPPYPDIKNPGITITDQSSGANKWNYLFGDGGTASIQNPNYGYKDSGAYFIKQLVENQFGCKDSSTKRLYVNFILFTHVPNAFSPGLDDINPLFQPTGLGIKDFKIIIFNRWGEKVFDPGWGRKAWDGIYLGEYVQHGIYPYYMEIMDFGNKRHSYNGVVTVIR